MLPTRRNDRPAIRDQGTSVSRRWVLRWGVIGSLAAVAAMVGGAFAVFFWPSRVGAFGGRVIAGRPDEFEVGVPAYVREGKFYLMRLPEGFLALYQKCPHLGCVIPWMPHAPSEDDVARTGRFNCPCHGSIFDRYGTVIRTPAPRPMDLMAIELVGGSLVVDTGDIRVRDSFDPGQVFRV